LLLSPILLISPLFPSDQNPHPNPSLVLPVAGNFQFLFFKYGIPDCSNSRFSLQSYFFLLRDGAPPLSPLFLKSYSSPARIPLCHIFLPLFLGQCPLLSPSSESSFHAHNVSGRNKLCKFSSPPTVSVHQGFPPFGAVFCYPSPQY